MSGAINKRNMQKGGIKKTFAIVLGVGAVVAVVVVIIVSVIIVVGKFSEIESVITEFIEAGRARNVEAACACWTLQWSTEEEIARFIERNYDELFAGFENLYISSCESESHASITEYYVTGTINYAGDPSLPFDASLVKKNDVWKITYIYIGYKKAVGDLASDGAV